MTTYTSTDVSNAVDIITGLKTAEERRHVLSVREDTSCGNAHLHRMTINV